MRGRDVELGGRECAGRVRRVRGEGMRRERG